MKDSLKNLLSMYPYFFKKDSTSNFYKSQSVTNALFQDVFQSLFEVIESFRLDKRVLVWREQTEPYLYRINFVANFPYLKSIKLYKNDDVIYSESFAYDDNVNSFDYSYEGSTLNGNNDNEVTIIPEDTFRIEVKTYEEYLIEKGYPENDVSQGDIFDHDSSLDEIGAFNNIPRKEYLLVSPELYPATEPPYNNRASEDDYHYINRILEYNMRLFASLKDIQSYEGNEEYLSGIGIKSKEEFQKFLENPKLFPQRYNPVSLELWKMYGIESELINREKYLIKLFDETKHDFDEETGLVGDWIPQTWEHKDKFCDYSQKIGVYFFIQCSTNIPTRKEIVGLDFMLINGYGENIANETKYYFDIYVDDTLIESNYQGLQYQIFPSQLSELTQTIIRVDCKSSLTDVIASSEVELRIRGCQDANIYVSPNGSDSNNGHTAETAVQTIQKACNLCVGTNDLIAVLPGTYSISSPVIVNKSCTIIGCENVTIENTTSNRFFKLGVGKELVLQDLDFEYDSTTNTLSDEKYTNSNEEQIVYVVVGTLDLPPFTPLPFKDGLIKNLSCSNHVISYDHVDIWELGDLNGVIYDLNYEEGVISYSEFELTGDELTNEDIEILKRAVTALTYENKTIKYDVVGEIIYD